MSEFGLSLPQTTKMGSDGKGPKAFIVKQSSMATIFAMGAVLLLLSGALYLDIRSERASFTSDLTLQHKVGAAERLAKIEAETKLQEVAAELSTEVGREMEEESDLKIMAQHISYVQNVVRINLHKTIDDEKLTVADIKKTVDKQFKAMEEEVEGILTDHLVTVTDANKKSQAAMQQIEEAITAELEDQEKTDKRYEEELKHTTHKPAADRAGPTLDGEEKLNAEKHINSVFEHVFNLAEKMGDLDIDALLKPTTVSEWEAILSDTESGKLHYDDAVKKMEEIITKDAAALKLAEATDAFELVHQDGGKKGVTEITNFRSLLKHIKWLPQYASVLEKLTKWKSRELSTQQIIVWVQEEATAGRLDQRWMTEAAKSDTTMKTTATPAAAASATTTGAPAASSSRTFAKAHAL